MSTTTLELIISLTKMITVAAVVDMQIKSYLNNYAHLSSYDPSSNWWQSFYLFRAQMCRYHVSTYFYHKAALLNSDFKGKESLVPSQAH